MHGIMQYTLLGYTMKWGGNSMKVEFSGRIVSFFEQREVRLRH